MSDPDWSRNPIDRFVLAKMEAEGIKPVAAADRRTLIRRLYLDLIGLPPEPDEVRAFLDDKSPDAVARVVDRLLARPQYGERWARHWLDVVRYAETNGYERDGDKPNAWRYRDYVIDALNRDKPYDRFLTEQLAGDEVEGSDAPAQIATTFLRLGTWDDEPAEPMVDRYDQLDDVLGTAATAFLGITLRCARCHDHKFEPFSQVDYYRMLAVFEPLKRPQNDRDRARPPGRDRGRAGRLSRGPCHGPTPSSAGLGADRGARSGRRSTGFSHPAKHSKNGKAAPKRTSLPPLRSRRFGPSRRSGRRLSGRSRASSLPSKLEDEVRAIAPEEVKAALAPLDDRIAAIKAAAPKELPHAYIWYEDGPKAPVTHVLKRGDPDQAGDAVEPGVPAVLAAQAARRPEADRQVDRSQALAGSLADQPGKPAGGAGDRQPDLAVPLRRGARRVLERFWRHGRRAQPSRAARLAGLRARGLGLAAQAAAPDDRAVADVPAVVGFPARSRQGRLRRHVALAVAAAASRGRGRPRLDPGGQRTVEPADGRPGLLSDAPRGGARGPVAAGRGLGQVGRSRTIPAQHLYLRQAQPGGPRARAARRARHHE